MGAGGRGAEPEVLVSRAAQRAAIMLVLRLLSWAYADWEGVALAAGVAGLLLLTQVLRTRRLGRGLGQTPWRLTWKLPLRLLTGLALGAALLGPSFGVSTQPVRTAGKDLWLVVDVSRSMDAGDVAPSRLLRAQAELTQLVQQFPADRVGLVAFGAQASLLCPLTYDQEAALAFVATLRTRLLPPGPTRLREPLDLVLARLNATNSTTAPRATAVVVVSDGEDFGENLEPGLRGLARSGARVYAVAVGTAAGAAVPLPNGRRLRDGRGREVRTRLREGPLLQLAAQTGGLFVELNDQQNGLPRLLEALRRLQGPTEQVRTVAVADNHYRYPLAAALLLLALDVLLTIRVLRP